MTILFLDFDDVLHLEPAIISKAFGAQQHLRKLVDTSPLRAQLESVLSILSNPLLRKSLGTPCAYLVVCAVGKMLHRFRANCSNPDRAWLHYSQGRLNAANEFVR